jgi:hypothetical protein
MKPHHGGAREASPLSFKEETTIMTSMTYGEFKAELDRALKQFRELSDRTTAGSLAALSDDAFAEECEHFAYLKNKIERLFAAALGPKA